MSNNGASVVKIPYLFVFLQLILNAHCKTDDLQFWSRDPKFWNRRNKYDSIDSLNTDSVTNSINTQNGFNDYGPKQHVRYKILQSEKVISELPESQVSPAMMTNRNPIKHYKNQQSFKKEGDRDHSRHGKKSVPVNNNSDVEAWLPSYETNYNGDGFADTSGGMNLDLTASNSKKKIHDRNTGGQENTKGAQNKIPQNSNEDSREREKEQDYGKENQSNQKGGKVRNKKRQTYNKKSQSQNKKTQHQKTNSKGQDLKREVQEESKEGQYDNTAGQNPYRGNQYKNKENRNSQKKIRDRLMSSQENGKVGQDRNIEGQDRNKRDQDRSKGGQNRNKGVKGHIKKGKVQHKSEHGQNIEAQDYELGRQVRSTVGLEYDRGGQNSEGDNVHSNKSQVRQNFVIADKINYQEHDPLNIGREGIGEPNGVESRESHKSKSKKKIKGLEEKFKVNKMHTKKSRVRTKTEKSSKNPLRSNKYRNKAPIRTDTGKKFPNIDLTGEFHPHSIARELLCLQKRKSNCSSINNAYIEQQIIGRTANYYDIVLWKIKDKQYFRSSHRFRASDSHKYEDDVLEKKIIFIVHGLSVMGWHKLPCLSVVSQFQKLLSYYLENLDSFDIYLVPMANPDGVMASRRFEYWNKNQSPQGECPGVSLDRNFDIGWNVSRNISTCHQQYPGPSPFSERESRAIREVFHLYGSKIAAYFHVHSGTYDNQVHKGDAILYPKGFTEAQTDDDKYVDLKGELEEAMKNASFKRITVTVDTLHSWYGQVAGTSVDYASSIYGVPYALEFVMQLFKNEEPASFEKTQDFALTELWQVLIDVTFDHIYRNEMKKNDNK